MFRSTDRILTTHTGSLPRPPELIDLMRRREQGEAVDESKLASTIKDAVGTIIRQQLDAGIDIVSDGEAGKPGYATYIRTRASGFDGTRVAATRPGPEQRDFPEYAERRAATQVSIVSRPSCNDKEREFS